MLNSDGLIMISKQYEDIRAKESSTYFKQLVRDCIADLKVRHVTYCFTMEQVEAIKERISFEIDIYYNEIYTLRSEWRKYE